MGREHQEQIIDTLKKSKASLKHLFLKYRYPVDTVGQDLLESLPDLVSLRVIHWYDSCRIRLRRSSNNRDSQADGSNNASSLRVLWYRADRSVFDINSTRFENLVSLDTRATLSSSDWRAFLEGPSRNLKQLRLGFRNGRYEDHSAVPSLLFPNLEVLELGEGGIFPQWILIPDSAKLITEADVSNLPSISELWSLHPASHESDIVNRLPRLRTLCLSTVYDLDSSVEILTERKANVEAGLHVDGVKMEMIKTLILPYDSHGDDLSDLDEEI